LIPVEAAAVPQHIVTRQAGAVTDHIAGRGLRAGDGVSQGKIEQGRVHRAIPIKLARIDQHGETGDREGFTDRADGKHGIRCDSNVFADIADTIASAKNRLAVLNNAHCQARHMPLG